eukprot:1808332-Pyramimonas_sp.AAC.3
MVKACALINAPSKKSVSPFVVSRRAATQNSKHNQIPDQMLLCYANFVSTPPCGHGPTKEQTGFDIQGELTC